ncbi:hypothetical protein L3X38_008968 [Prunus dulcis]|uniref:Protein FAR1-RELATED SEQUENCE n=1 Tax=Prunus dulcis TaxID=3755 RepID=A0AAD5F7M2_PRUDU|nr:hypothetical protein L3X38_008968 [Prunus dulcis]
MENNCMEDGEGETSTGLNISEGESNKKSSQAMKGKREIDKRVSNVKYHRAETRCGCLARMKISCHLNDKYRVIEFVSEHNHVTTSPSKTHLFRSHRKITFAQIAEVDMADSSGIAPKTALEFLSRQAGGRESLGFIPDDYKNYLHSKRTREMKLGDTGGVLEYLQQMQLTDPNFFYAIQVDEDDLITNIFWDDARMMVDYDYFGDVVCFDTTYRKNKEGRPFAMFVGVNHHKQTIIFGAALLYDETIQIFTWLFDTFVKAMSGKKPKSILTDQDAAMSAALALKWLETSHRLCLWHIYQNAAKHLSGVFEKFKDFSKDFSSCIYDYEDEDAFLNACNSMLEKYTLILLLPSRVDSICVDSICVPTTKAVPAPPSEISQAQSPLEGTGAKSSSVEVDPPFSIDKSHQAS